MEILLRGLPATLTLAGTAVDVTGVGIFPYQNLLGKADMPLLADGDASSGTFSLTLTDPPLEEAWITGDPDWNYAFGILQTYTDTDESGGYTAKDDRASLTTCFEGNDAIARYTKPVTAWRGWRLMECYSGNAGWRLVTEDVEGGWKDFRTSAEAASLTIEDGTCHW